MAVFALKKKDIFKNQKRRLKRDNPFEYVYFEYYFDSLFLLKNNNILYNKIVGEIYEYKNMLEENELKN